MNCDDETSEDLIKIYTFMDRDSVDGLITRHRENPGDRELQRTLAASVTDIVHSENRRKSIERVNDVLFGSVSVAELSDEETAMLSEEIPTASIGKTVVEALVESSAASSNSDARRLLAGGAISVNGQKVTDDQALGGRSLIKKGKNTFVLVQ